LEILVVIPTYNEADNLPNLVASLASLGLDLGVLVVDDASPDGTAALALGLRQTYPWLNVLQRQGKLGLGTAYVDGFTWALAHSDASLVVQMDADFSHDPLAVPSLVQAARQGAVAIGSRYVPGGQVKNWKLGRRLLSRGGSLYARLILGLPLRDVTGGFKCWPRPVLQALDLGRVVSDGYAFQVEMNYRAFSRGCRLVEVPICFEDRRVGQSKMTMGIGLEALAVVWRLRLQKNL
jgi:dolichol-phosphate mannosyltransferase